MMIQLTIINAFKMSETKFWEKKKIGRKSKKKKKKKKTQIEILELKQYTQRMSSTAEYSGDRGKNQ